MAARRREHRSPVVYRAGRGLDEPKPLRGALEAKPMRVLQVCDTYPPDGRRRWRPRRAPLAPPDRPRARGQVVAVGADAQGEEAGEASRCAASPLARAGSGGLRADSPPFHPPWPDPAFPPRAGASRGRLRARRRPRPRLVRPLRARLPTRLERAGGGAPCTITAHLPEEIAAARSAASARPGRGPACLRCDDQPLPKRAALAAALAVTTPKLQSADPSTACGQRHVARRAEQVGVPADLIEVRAELRRPPGGDRHPDGRRATAPPPTCSMRDRRRRTRAARCCSRPSPASTAICNLRLVGGRRQRRGRRRRRPRLPDRGGAGRRSTATRSRSSSPRSGPTPARPLPWRRWPGAGR